MTNQAEFDRLRWHKFPVLDDGFVTLVDKMGDDSAVTQAARVSYGNDARGEGVDKGDDRGLVRYLMRHHHTTPFEMAEIKLLVRVPMDTWRQWIRTRTASVNERSSRYTTLDDGMQKTAPDAWRKQATNNKQGSEGLVTEWPSGAHPDSFNINGRGQPYATPERLSQTPGEWLSEEEADFHQYAREVYEQRLKFGVAKEQARKDLPLSQYTEAYWKIDLHNLLNFLWQRMDSHAQWEIRQYANTIGEQIVKPLFPLVWEAFEDYRLGAMTLTRLEQIAFTRIVQYMAQWSFDEQECEHEFHAVCLDLGWTQEKCRERDECREKLVRLGVLK